ncbi:MAG: acyltransferase [Actinobacteria bacterium]|nr:acyltransferase [Actinomycetota bacterium]
MVESGRESSRSFGFRADVQGLRAVAVILVVLEHVFAWPSGGFVGVDVFFVISGFLITGLLLREYETTGRISLRGFYARRARRILPAATLVLTVTVAVAVALWFVPRALQTAIDALSAALFVSNWHFIGVNVDYLAGGAAISPVQHFWSLSIEEQFYAMWPLLLLILLPVLRGSRRVLGVAIAVLMVISLAWAAYRTQTLPTAAYFDTGARVWELMAGALVAVTGAAGSRVPVPVRRVVSALGVVLIVASAVLVQPVMALPFPWVLPAVLGAVLVVWAAAPVGPRSLLGNRVARWFGDISYSLYLWHLPVYVFAISVFGQSPMVGLACLLVMVGLSALSHRFVERPFIRRGGHAPRPAAARSTRTQGAVPRFPLLGWLGRVAALALVAVLVIGLGYSQVKGPMILRSADAATSWFTRPPAVQVDKTMTQQAQQDAVREALATSSWPAGVRGELNHLSRNYGAKELTSRCMNRVTQTRNPQRCGHPTKDRVMLLGDSAAISWMPTVRSYAQMEGLGGVSAMGFSNCSLFEVPATDRTGLQSFVDGCADRREQMFEFAEKYRPSVLFLSASESVIGLTGLPLDRAVAAYRTGVERTLERLEYVPLVVILTGPPHVADPRSCATRINSPVVCVGEVSQESTLKDAADTAAASGFPNAVTVPTSSWFCDGGRCPIFVGEHLTRIDPSHLAEPSALRLGPVLADALAGVQLPRTGSGAH